MFRATLAAVEDPDDELTVSAATRHRIEGAASALEAVASYAVGATADSKTR